MGARARLVACLLAVIAVLGACRGGDAPSALSKAEFIRQADALCEARAERFGELEDPDGEGGAKPLGLGDFVIDWAQELQALEPPPADARVMERALAHLERSGELLNESEAADRDGESDAAESAQSEALFVEQPKAQKLIGDYGFHVCFQE